MTPRISGIQNRFRLMDGDDILQNQVLGRVNNNSKLIPEALVVPNETFETKPEFQQQKGKAWSRVQPVQFEARYGESVKVLTHTKEYKIKQTIMKRNVYLMNTTATKTILARRKPPKLRGKGAGVKPISTKCG